MERTTFEYFQQFQRSVSGIFNIMSYLANQSNLGKKHGEYLPNEGGIYAISPGYDRFCEPDKRKTRTKPQLT